MSRADELYAKYSTKNTSGTSRKSKADELYEKYSTKKDVVDEKYINKYIDDFNTYVNSVEDDYNNISYSNAKSYSNKYSQSSSNLTSRASAIENYLEANKDSLDADDYKNLSSYIKQSKSALGTTSNAFNTANEFYAQWETEDDYNNYLKGIGERQELLSYDTSAAKRKIAELDSQIASLEKNISDTQSTYNSRYGSPTPAYGNNDPYANAPNNGGYGQNASIVGSPYASPYQADEMSSKLSAAQDELAKLKEERNTLNVTYNRATYLQSADQLTKDALNAEDFEVLSEKGADNDLAKKQEAYKNGYQPGEATTLTLEQRFAKYAKDEEMDVYSYYIGKGDTESAQKYLESVEETINARKGLEMYEAVEDNTALEMAFGVAAGLNQFTTGIGNLFEDKDYYTPTATAMASASVREDLADVGFNLPEFMGGSSLGQAGYDMVTTTANMMPSILASAAVTYATKGAATPAVAQALSGAVGSVTLGASAAGNAYAEMINLGYDKGQAKTYAALVGGSEAGLQYLMGGVSKLGGVATKKGVTALVNNIDNAFARGAIKFGMNMASEGLEEYAQEILDPFFRNLALGETNDLKLYTPEALYSGVLGALSAGLLDGVPSGVSSAANAARTYRTGKAIKSNTDFNVDNLKKLGSTMSADSIAYKIANKIDNKTGAYTIGKLFNSIGAELSVQNKADIVKSLTRKGVAEKNANTIADWLGAVVSGAKLTKSQISALEKNEVIADTFRDVIINKNSTANQRMQGLYEAGGFDVSSGIDVNSVSDAYTADAVIDRINDSQMFETPFSASLDTQLKRLAGDVVNTTDKTTPFIPTAKPEMDATKAKAIEDIAAKYYKTSETKGETTLDSTNESVNIKKIASIKGNNMTLELDDGRTVSAKDVSYASEGEALVYETVANMDVPVDVANNLVSMYNPTSGQSAKVFAKGIEEAYRYGLYSIPKYEMLARTSFTAELTAKQRDTAYELGKIMGKDSVGNAPATRTKNAKGRVVYDGDRKHLSDIRKTSLKGLEVLAKVTGLHIEVFESPTNKKGRHIGENGSYDPKTGTMRIDLYSGADGKGVMLYTAAHELVHHIKVWSPAKFKILADFLMEQYGEKGVSVDTLVRQQMDKAKRNGRTLTYDAAYEEVIADSMESMLADGAVIEKLQKLAKQDQSLVQKIESFLKELVAKIEAAYKGLKPDSDEGKFVADMLDTTERLQELFTEAIMDASVNYKNAKLNNIEVYGKSNFARLSERYIPKTQADIDRLVGQVAKGVGVSIAEARKYVNSELSLSSIILGNKYLDYTGDSRYQAIKKNSDYKQGTVDFSNICRKRRAYTAMLDRLQAQFPNRIFTASDMAIIRQAMLDNDLEVACAVCYVEDRRQLLGEIANGFIENYKTAKKTGEALFKYNAAGVKSVLTEKGTKNTFTAEEYIPTIYDLITLEGMTKLQKNHPNIAKAFTTYNNARGMQSGRLLEGEAEYKREILNYSDDWVKEINNLGGLRIYSFSDFEEFHLVDVVQVIMDCAAKGVKIQGYTKVPAFAKLLKDTNVKLNRSLIPKGKYGYHYENVNGKNVPVLDFDNVEGINTKDEDFFDSKNSKNIGNILIGINDEQIKIAMLDDMIDYIIPFHTGQSEDILKLKKINEWVNYKNFQEEKDASKKKVDKSGKVTYGKAESGVNIYTDVLQAAENEGKPILNERQFVEKFLAVCKERNLIPRFYNLLNMDGDGNYIYTKGYYKLLLDFKLFDSKGNILPQENIVPDFDTGYMHSLLDKYSKQKAKEESIITDKLYKKIIDSAIQDGLDLKLSDRDSDYMAAVESGNMRKAQSLVEDAAIKSGLKYVGLHGTENFGFTEFDRNKSYKGGAHFFTTKFRVADSYSGAKGVTEISSGANRGTYKVALDIKNPLEIDCKNHLWNDIPYNIGKSGKVSTVDVVAYAEKQGYDGVIFKNLVDAGQNITADEDFDISYTDEGKAKWSSTVFAVFDSRQIKSLDAVTYDNYGDVIPLSKRFDMKNSDIRYSDRDSDLSYESLVAKPDMALTTVDNSVSYTPSAETRKNIVDTAIKNATSVGYANEKGNAVVYVKDIGTDVIVSKKSIQHSLDRRLNVLAPILHNIGSILQESIIINKLMPRSANIDESYVLIGAAKNTKGELYIVRSIVNRYTGNVDNLDVLYATHTKKESAALDEPAVTNNSLRITDSIISISNLLDYVNKYFPDILPEDVFRHYGHTERPSGDVGESALFSDRDPDAITPRNLLANALESTVTNDIERKKLEQYKKKIDSMNAEEKKLSEIRKEIKELSFSKGKRDTEKLKTLNAEATKSANRIATYDRQLLNLESTQAIKNVLEREKKKATERQKARDKEALKAYKEQVEQRQEKILADYKQKAKEREQGIRDRAKEREQNIREAYQESRQNATESRHRTEMRNKIKKVVNELNQYLLKGTKDKHVMEGMQKAVAEALSIVNMDTVDADARVAKYDALIAEATDPDVIEALTATRDRIQGQGDRLADKLTSLKSAYADIINSSDPTLSNAYDEVIESKIVSVLETVGDTSLRNMSMEQLEEVYDLYKMVLTNIRNANKLFASEKQETIEQLGYEVDSEVKTATKQKDRMTAINSFLRKIGYKELKPIYFFRMLGSKTMTDLYKKVRDGQGTWFKDAVEARAFRIKTEREYNYKKWDLKETYKFTAKSGKSFELTLPQIMSIYAFSRREQAFDHLVKGGIVFDDAVKVKEKKKGVTLSYTVNTSEAFNLSVDTLGEIIDTLTEEQKSYVKDMQSYLSDTMGGKGNEVSMELYGVKLFKEKNYFPLKSSQYYMNFTAEEAGETKIKNSSFSKETVKHANNPIVLSDFIDVWAKHVNDMSMYHAFVLPLEDFTRVYNYRTPTSEDVETTSVKSTIHNHYTEAANSYIKQLLKDINGGSVSGVGTEVVDKMVGLAKKGAVFASFSVVVQQPSAIARAMAYVNPKYFANVSAFNFRRHKQLWEECKQYAPVAGIKEMGYFDTGVGRTGIDWLKTDEYNSFKEKSFAFLKDKEQRRNIFDDALSKAPAMADELSWVALWEAVKKETRKTTNLEVGSEEFFKYCGERFTEVVDLTQVYDSVFSRSELMRSKDRAVKMATSFMAEPTVQANMIFDAVLQVKRGKKSALALAAATIGAVVGSVVLNSILKSFVTAGRDDDDDETYFEKYVASFAGDVLNGLNPLTLIPFVKDIISITQGYSVERMDTSVVGDIIGSIMDIGKDTKSDMEKVLGLIGSVANLFGVPAKNIIRDVNSAINAFNTLTSGDKTTGTGIKFALLEGLSETVTANLIKGVTGNGIDAKKGKQYYDAAINGDKDFIRRNESNESVVNSFKNIVKESIQGGDISVEKGANLLSKYGGVDEEKAFENAQYYDFVAQNPDLNATWNASTVASYLEKAEPSGISVKVYDDYLVKKAKCKGTDKDGDGKADDGTKKKEILKVINSLPITSKQKDVLFLMNYSKSTLWEAPWH